MYEVVEVERVWVLRLQREQPEPVELLGEVSQRWSRSLVFLMLSVHPHLHPNLPDLSKDF